MRLNSFHSNASPMHPSHGNSPAPLPPTSLAKMAKTIHAMFANPYRQKEIIPVTLFLHPTSQEHPKPLLDKLNLLHLAQVTLRPYDKPVCIQVMGTIAAIRTLLAMEEITNIEISKPAKVFRP